MQFIWEFHCPKLDKWCDYGYINVCNRFDEQSINCTKYNFMILSDIFYYMCTYDQWVGHVSGEGVEMCNARQPSHSPTPHPHLRPPPPSSPLTLTLPPSAPHPSLSIHKTLEVHTGCLKRRGIHVEITRIPLKYTSGIKDRVFQIIRYIYWRIGTRLFNIGGEMAKDNEVKFGNPPLKMFTAEVA